MSPTQIILIMIALVVIFNTYIQGRGGFGRGGGGSGRGGGGGGSLVPWNQSTYASAHRGARRRFEIA